MCFSINTHLHRTGKPRVKTHNVVFYNAALVQYTDINLPMEYTAFLCPAKVKMEAHIFSEMFGIYLPDYMVS